MVVHLMPAWATPKIPTLGVGRGGVMRGKIGFNQLHLAQVPNGTREGCTRGTHEPETMHEETQAQSQALGNLQQMFG